MIYIHYVNPTGLFSYGYSPNVNFENGTLINLIGVNEDTGGSSNGAGKSSLFNSICELLFGENPTGINGPSVVNNIWDKGCCSRLEFTSWENIRYRITLCRDWKEQYYEIDNNNSVSYTGTGLFLDKLIDNTWVDYRGIGITDTKKKILEKIGITYNRFLSVSYMSNRVGDKFLRGTNKDRMDILSGVTGIEEWDPILSKCRKNKSKLDEKINNLKNDISYQEGSLNSLKGSLLSLNQTDWKDNKLNYEKNFEEMTSEKLKIESKIEKLNSDISKLNKKKVCDLGYIFNEIRKYNNEILEIKSSTYNGCINKKLLNDLDKANDEFRIVKSKLSLYCNENNNLLNLKICPTCNKEINEEDKNKIRSKISDLNCESDKYNSILQEILLKVELEKERIKLETNKYEDKKNNIIKQLQNCINDLQSNYEKSKGEEEKHKDILNNINNQINFLKMELSRVINNINNIPNWIKICDDNLKSIRDLELSICDIEKNIDSINIKIHDIMNKIYVYEWLIYNIPYIKIHKLSISMDLLSGYINEFLSKMGDTIRVDVEAFKEKKSKTSVSDFTGLLKGEVNVRITDGPKDINSKLYSDGEISKISNVLTRSLRELSLNYGHGCNILMLDEIFSYMDYNNSQRLSSSFLKTNNGTIIMTDNSGKANDLIDFDNIWIARKRNNITNLEVL